MPFWVFSSGPAGDPGEDNPEWNEPARIVGKVEELGGRGFRPKLEVEAGEAATVAESRSGPRRDLIDLPTFTVDPATARDFDDAVSARREDDGVRLWIHIADVAAHVPPGSPLDAARLGADDEVLALDGRAVADYASFEEALRRVRPGDSVTLRVHRRAAAGPDTVTVRATEDPRVEIVTIESIGGTITDEQRQFRESWLAARR